jgi:hypothetical protein
MNDKERMLSAISHVSKKRDEAERELAYWDAQLGMLTDHMYAIEKATK